MPFRRPNRSSWYVTLRTPGCGIRKSTETSDKPTAKAIERAIRDLEHRREWPLLNAVIEGRLTVGQLYDAVRHRRTDALTASLNDTDIEPLVEEWLVGHGRNVSPDTVDHYRHAVRSLIVPGVPFPLTDFTTARLTAWIAGYPGSSGTRRKAAAAMKQFEKFLVRQHGLALRPMDNVDIPKSGAPRTRYEEASVLTALADAHEEPYRTLSALLAGSGIEVSVALGLRRRDVDVANREIRAAGTKTYCRDRVVRVADWAWGYVERRCATLLPDALLFEGIDRFSAGKAHRQACRIIGLQDYAQRDHRHSYAVRAIRAGTPPELVAKQLGHANAIMVLKVYGRFAPVQAERDHWERIASLRDQHAALG
jgi:integrase